MFTTKIIIRIQGKTQQITNNLSTVKKNEGIMAELTHAQGTAAAYTCAAPAESFCVFIYKKLSVKMAVG